MKRFKLDCIYWGTAHVKFNVFDHKGANCGVLTIATEDVIQFVQHSWRGHIFWE